MLLASAMERESEYLATLESLNNGKPVHIAKAADLALSVKCMRYYAGWADKLTGKTIPIDGDFFCYTTREPVGVVGCIIPWNFPILMWWYVMHVSFRYRLFPPQFLRSRLTEVHIIHPGQTLTAGNWARPSPPDALSCSSRARRRP